MRLNRERLVDAALALVDDDGSEALSMRTLAARVDRQVSSLYNHVSGRTELIELMRARIVADIDVAAFASVGTSARAIPWERALEFWARSYLRAFAAHPNLIRLLATTEIRDLSTYEMYDAVIAGLRRGGWPESRTVAVMRTVEAHVLGSALDIIAPSDLIAQDSADVRFSEIRTALDPRFVETSSATAAFELGLNALIDGLRLQLEAGIS
ncbi:MAG: TetR/AcrR family transcriptional regulator C-terminal domain-containing protein [Brevibacterium aurantiacum]|uniref:TetR family transcriptional regulator n=1 Tax=Brevibacterium aurantiacum TaxID=273384 RepID=A0A1D7W643_BREAU|nr:MULTISPECIES: TetR/AcrR family transcriptional regulator C-terminal domain-containing protein [Brevibacterium]MDN5550918.1 TetR/AcrR family transcriptional regulator C-terminal domain-containing protein [Brevibacterium sp.]AOP54527.1 Transcriptional regulator, TetR family [Brevibacterium aurantiacum]AZL06479.1 TetR family transcriptional regulator [Brevibacterium aurantiacum]AZL10037.1 TetR family transcriptional regulator [Brevibacterium aurantiacum]AZL13693.1 TetR family transcriptional r